MLLTKIQTPPAAPAPAGRFTAKTLERAELNDVNYQDAGQMMLDHGIDLQNRSAMRENLATYLSHRTFGSVSPRWQAKIDRELHKPFTDDQVATRIDHLQKSLFENVCELPKMPSKVYITGSFARGRLGANSDLDGYAVLKPEDIGKGFDSFEKRVEAEDGACLFPLNETQPGLNRANLMMVAGATVTIDPSKLDQPGYLNETYHKVLADKSGDRRETAAAYEWLTSKVWKEGKTAASKRESFEGKSLVSKLTNGAMAFCGTMAAVPVVGPVLRWGANLCVKQQHSEPI